MDGNCGRERETLRNVRSRFQPLVTGCFRLYRKKQILRKRPFCVKPLLLATEPRPLPHLHHVLRIIFVRAFRPDRLALTQIKSLPRRLNRHPLPDLGPQMHFHAPLSFVIPRHVLKLRQIEIRAQLPVNSRQQIHIERCRHSRPTAAPPDHPKPATIPQWASPNPTQATKHHPRSKSAAPRAETDRPRDGRSSQSYCPGITPGCVRLRAAAPRLPASPLGTRFRIPRC